MDAVRAPGATRAGFERARGYAGRVSRPVDFSALTRAERIVLVAGLAGFANGFVPWWYRVATLERTVSYNAGLTGWSLIAVAAFALAAGATLARATFWPRPAPRWDGTAYGVLALFAIDAIAVQSNVQLGSTWIGVYAELAFALALGTGGWLRRRERKRGWS